MGRAEREEIFGKKRRYEGGKVNQKNRECWKYRDRKRRIVERTWNVVTERVERKETCGGKECMKVKRRIRKGDAENTETGNEGLRKG